MKFKLTYKTHIKIIMTSLLFIIIFYNKIMSSELDFLKATSNLYPLQYPILATMLIMLSLAVPITLVHEGIHAIFQKLYGGKVKFIFKIIYAAVQETSGNPLSLKQFTFVLLSPVIIISLICLLLPKWLGPLIFYTNLLGSFGDIYMTIGLLKYPTNSKIIDKSYGYLVINTFN
ncbi:DUF3267 domain-containing protein (plasmid) [Haloimpatiens sp. FM7330]|uniref:DUF3267 domain-containing protein n=1 Tax=Haloimpatiens sp. FM7330 TaxID=3298610 RepID=UPI00362BBA26